jgi:hypothetical protein
MGPPQIEQRHLAVLGFRHGGAARRLERQAQALAAITSAASSLAAVHPPGVRALALFLLLRRQTTLGGRAASLSKMTSSGPPQTS